MIRYTRYAIKGGYHIHSYLADCILFPSGFSYKDSNNKQLNSLENRIDNLTREELEDSFSAYKVSGIHGSQYAQIRLSEFYFYGVSVKRDIEMAYAWSMIANDSFIYFNKEGYKRHASERYKENILNEYNNVNLKNLIPLQMTKIEIERSVALASKIKETLVEDDYYSWEVQMDAVPPAP